MGKGGSFAPVLGLWLLHVSGNTSSLRGRTSLGHLLDPQDTRAVKLEAKLEAVGTPPQSKRTTDELMIDLKLCVFNLAKGAAANYFNTIASPSSSKYIAH